MHYQIEMDLHHLRIDSVYRYALWRHSDSHVLVGFQKLQSESVFFIFPIIWIKFYIYFEIQFSNLKVTRIRLG
jgi:hypothetical protein